MLTRIVHNSEKLCTFVEQLGLDLSQPQWRHLRNMAGNYSAYVTTTGMYLQHNGHCL